MSSQHRCPNCAKLEAENRALKAKIRELLERIRRIKKLIQRALTYAAAIEEHASQHMVAGNLARAAWSYFKAMRDTAYTLKQKIGEAYALTILQ